jgi:hypothetical protein
LIGPLLAVAAAVGAAAPNAGADLPFTTYEAEDAASTGEALGPDRRFGSLAAEASGRRAIKLVRKGQEVTFTLRAPANALTLRYAIPDSADGKGRSSRVAVYVAGQRVAEFPLTSRYGWFYGRYPFVNDPRKGGGHHFYDHARIILPGVLAAGTDLTIRREETDIDWIAIDLIDAELAPPPRVAPPDALSVLDFGADPRGIANALPAFRAAIVAAQASRRPVWVPAGIFRLPGHLTVDRVTLAGAGHWYSELRGAGVGLYGKAAPRGSHHVHLRDFAVIGEVDERKDHRQLAAIGGALSDSTVADLWLQHEKVGLWLDGPMSRLTISRLRIVDQTADGINFHRGVTDSVVEDSFVRSTGDDGLAMWSQGTENARNVFRRNTINLPILANGIAIYGGRDIIVSDNLVADTVTQGGGVHVGSRFGATPFAGTITLSGNVVRRGGSWDPNWRSGIGAMWFYALDQPIAARISVTDTRLIDSSYAGVQLVGRLPITDVSIDRLTIDGAGQAFQIDAPGAGTARGVIATRLRTPDIAPTNGAYRLTDGGGNRGWTPPVSPAP